jgi:hypothetical protein
MEDDDHREERQEKETNRRPIIRWEKEAMIGLTIARRRAYARIARNQVT